MGDTNWALGYKASYYLSILDKDTMRDIDRIELTGGSIKRSLSDLRESADLNCINYNNQTEQYIRVWLDTKQEGNSSHTPLFTGIATSPLNKFSGRRKTNAVQCYSMLKVAEDIMLPRGWYAPVDANGGKLIKNLLSVIGVEVNVAPESPILSQAIIAEQSENHLSMTDKILASINWCMRLDGYGNINVGPVNKDFIETFDSNKNDIIETEIDVEYDWFSAPNVLRATLDDSYAVAKDERPESPLSIQNRGREVWFEDNNVQLNRNETLAEYTNRMLYEYQRVATRVSYSRRFWPGIYPGDVVRLNYPAQSVQGNFLITDQSITLGYNARTSEGVIQI